MCPLLPAPPRGRGGTGRAARVSESALSSEVLPSLPPFPAQAALPSACFLDLPWWSLGEAKWEGC